MKIMVIDSNSILNRAFYGIKLLTTRDGTFTNAIYGFFNITLKLLDDYQPDMALFAFDLKAPTFRHQMYEGYKANRKGMPPELAQQLPLVKEAIGLLGYPVVTKEGFEADDILGTVAREGEQAGDEVYLVTGDRDSLQLVDEKVTVILAHTRPGGAEYLLMTPEKIREQYGVTPEQLIETKALMGDSSDNIPGVKGIGEKTAFTLIQKYGSVENIYRDFDSLELTPSVRKKLSEGREMAELSRTLGIIRKDAPLGDWRTDCQRKPVQAAELYRLLNRLELNTLIKRLNLEPSDAETSEETDEAQEPLELFPGTNLSAFASAETVYAFGITAGDDLTALMVSDGRRAEVYETLTDSLLLEFCTLPGKKILNDSKPFHRAALRLGKTVENLELDLRLAGYLLSPNASEYTVERLSGAYHVNWPEPVWHGDGEVPEGAADLARMPALSEQIRSEITENQQEKLLFEVEQPLAEVLASMELIGVTIDLEGLRNYGAELTAQAQELEQEIYRLAGKTFNINSPKQLGEVLFEDLQLPTRKKNKRGYSTDAEVLESLAPYHEIVARILDYRKYTKLISTYVEGLDKAAGADGVIHSSFNQTETRTGRISSAEPNLQNIPIRSELGSKMREFFLARPGCLLVDADYSQIELRVLAAMAKDETMTEAFLSGEDIHTKTAAQVFDLPPLFVTPLMRSRAKAVNFGIVYGIGAFSLAKDIGVSIAEADRYIKNYLNTYHGVADYMNRVVEEAKQDGYVSTLFGRRRYLPELKSSNHNLRSFGQRVAMNMPIQGTAADIIKVAMVNVYRKLREEGLKSRLILQIHDELIVEGPAEEAARASEIVRQAMEQAVQLTVPLEVDLNTGRTWAEAH